MRIGGEAATFSEFLAKVLELVFVETAFEEGTGVDARGGVALEINEVAGKLLTGARRKWLKATSYKVAAEA